MLWPQNEESRLVLWVVRVLMEGEEGKAAQHWLAELQGEVERGLEEGGAMWEVLVKVVE